MVRIDFENAGREFVDELGLAYHRRWWYDPALERFLSEDPAQADPNLYRYAGNDPVNYGDPSGLVIQKPTSYLAGLNNSSGSVVLDTFRSAPRRSNIGTPLGSPVSLFTQQMQALNFQAAESAYREQFLRDTHRAITSFELSDIRRREALQAPYRNDPVYRAFTALNNPYVQGGLQVVQAGGEAGIATALAFAPEPTLVTKVGAGALYAKSIDTLQAGVRTLRYGSPVDSAFQSAATSAARGVGLPEPAARITGGVIDAGPSLVDGIAVARQSARAAGILNAGARSLTPAASIPAVDDLRILTPRFTPDSQRILQSLTNRAYADVSANPAILQGILKPRQYRALAGSARSADAIFGTGIEKYLGRTIANDPLLSSILVPAAQRGARGQFIRSADFIGIEGARYRPLEITTFKGVPEHLARPAGTAVDFVIHPGRGNIKFP